MVIPIVEERVIVTKRPVLVEETCIKKIRRNFRELPSVELRREEVVVDRENQNLDERK